MPVTTVSPHIPIPLGTIPARTRLNEPRMLVRRVARHQVNHHFDIARMRFVQQHTKIIQTAKYRINILIIRHVIAKVSHGRREKWRNPNGINAEITEIVHLERNAIQIPDPVTVQVSETSRINLIQRSNITPRFSHVLSISEIDKKYQ